MRTDIQQIVTDLEKIQTASDLQTWKTANKLSQELFHAIWTRIQDLLVKNPKDALRLSEWMLSLAVEANDASMKALALRAKGNALFSVDEYFQAVEYYDEALRIFKEIDDRLEVARTMMSRVVSYLHLSRFDEALADAGRVTEMFTRLGDERRLAFHFINVGHLYFRLDRFAENIEMLDKAEAILTRLNDVKSLCGVYVNRAVVLTSLNKADEAFKYYALAKQLSLENDMPLLVSECDYNICYLYFLQGQYTKALELLNTVRKHMKECGDRLHLAFCDLDQSEIYLELNMHQDAIELAQEAYAGFKSLGMRYEMAKALAFEGIAHNHLRNYGNALELFDQARAMFSEQGNEVWLSLIDLYQGIVYFQTGRYYEALDLARKAYTFFSNAGLKTKSIYAQLLIARLHLQLGNLTQASSEAEAARRSQGETRAPWLGYQIQFVIGDILARQGDSGNAQSAFRKAVEELEVLRTNIHVDELRMTFLKDKLKIYEAVVRSGLEINDSASLREAFQAVEHAKSRTLVDLLANNIAAVHPKRESDTELAEHLRTIREELNWYYTRINLEEQKANRPSDRTVQTLVDEVHKRENQLIKLLRQVSAEETDYVTLQRVTTSSLEDIQKTLPPDAVLIEFYIVEGRVIAFALTRDDFRVFQDLALESTLRRGFDLLRFQLTKFNLGVGYVEKFGTRLLDAIKEHLYEIYSELITPLQTVLQGRRSIVFVPHGFLHYIPFHALFDGSRYLIDDYEISYAPSATIYKACIPGNRNPGGPPLVIGVPDVRAPEIVDEVRGIHSVLTDANVLVGPEATAERLRRYSKDSRIIHIASHGAFRNDNPMFSSIQLGDTWLSLFDIYNLKISTELVTLSGCGTGMSKIVGGDELVGLVRGFLYAGARSVLVSLWDVHDRSTAELMRMFYANLAAGLGRWESLRAAIIVLKQKEPHPYYWAPFVGIGAP